METTTLASFVAVLIWLIPFAVGKSFHWEAAPQRRSLLSATAGIALAYVFIDLLPQMSRMQQAFLSAAREAQLPAPQFRVYVAALAGFLLFYTLHNIRDQTGELAEPNPLFDWADFLGFALYCAVIGYLLLAEPRSPLSLALYTAAMFFHFWPVDHALREEHGELYDRSGRWIIAGGLVAGWAAAVLGLSSKTLVPTLVGFVGGGVVMNSIRGELPHKGKARAIPFILGSIAYAALLVAVELVEA